MNDLRHIIVVHHHPLVAEALDVALSGQGFVVHPAVTYREARTLVARLKVRLTALVAHADMPNEPHPGTLLRAVEHLHPEAALVIVSARLQAEIGPLPDKSVLLPEPFDRDALMDAIATASSLPVSHG
jgi:DNA-binding NarL/FixJ family response regulator